MKDRRQALSALIEGIKSAFPSDKMESIMASLLADEPEVAFNELYDYLIDSSALIDVYTYELAKELSVEFYGSVCAPDLLEAKLAPWLKEHISRDANIMPVEQRSACKVDSMEESARKLAVQMCAAKEPARAAWKEMRIKGIPDITSIKILREVYHLNFEDATNLNEE